MFESARLKLQRAKHHIDNLKTTFSAFVDGNPHTFSVGSNPNGEVSIQVSFRNPIPESFALIIGDAIHNLRTVLDHATWELIGIDGGTQDQFLSFPARIFQGDYEATCNGIKTPRSDTKKFFVSLAAYRGGSGNELHALHALDNADKHTVMIPIIGMTRMQSVKIIGPNGRTIAELENCAFQMGGDGRSIINAGAGCTIELDQQTNPTIDIFFRGVEMFAMKPAIPALMHLANAVADTLGKFEIFVRDRTT
jgi:hypothetical protein